MIHGFILEAIAELKENVWFLAWPWIPGSSLEY